MTTVIADCETDNLLDKMTVLHMLQIGDADGDDAIVYADLPKAQAEDVARRKLLRHPIRPLGEGVDRIVAADTMLITTSQRRRSTRSASSPATGAASVGAYTSAETSPA